jgi:hypothetical protein
LPEALDTGSVYRHCWASRYFKEAEFENLIGTLKNRILSRVVSMEIPLIEDNYIYILIFIGILINEWIIRRRMNLL